MVAVQNLRGRYNSQGVFLKVQPADATDDTVAFVRERFPDVDVQVEVPGSSRFVPWQATTALGGGYLAAMRRQPSTGLTRKPVR